MIQILYEDKDAVVCIKPAGVPSQLDKSGDAHMKMLLEEQTGGEIFVVHRLDRNVGGVMVYAKTEKAAAELSAQFAQNGSAKEYVAVVCGNVKKKDELCDWLLKNSRLNISKVVNKNSPNSKEARLFYKPLKYAEKDGKILTLIHIKLFTGRHHQIRVQMANAGFPIYADTKYNKDFLRQRVTEPIGLWAISLEIKINGEKRKFSAKPKAGIFNLFV